MMSPIIQNPGFILLRVHGKYGGRT